MLGKELSGRGAVVWAIWIPPGEDGSRRGADDVIAQEGDEAWAELLARVVLLNPPEIKVTTNAATVLNAAQDALIRARVRLYCRGGVLVHIIRGESKDPAWLERQRGSSRIALLKQAHLHELFARFAIWLSLHQSKRSEEWRRCLPPKWAPEMLLARGEWPFPPLFGIAETPVLRPDGRILQTAGYDPATGILFDPCGVAFPIIKEIPTQKDAVAALACLSEPFCDFAFRSPEDLVVAIAQVLSGLARPAIAGPVPAFANRSPTPGSGKGLLADVGSIITTGRPAPRMAAPKTDEEAAKRITTIAIAADPLVVIDNVIGPFGGEAFSAALTTTIWKDRLLGFNQDVELPLRTIWVVTGNNISFRGDFGRRVLPCDLDPGVEHPEDRTDFRHPELLKYVHEERPRLVAAGLTILRAYHVAGRPPHGKPLKGSFEDWDRIVRGALLWCGLPDPLGTTSRIREDGDADLAALRGGLQAWEAMFGVEAKTAAQAVERAKELGTDILTPLAELARCAVKDLDGRKLGYAVRGVQGRIVGGRCFKKDSGKTAGSARWSVQKRD